MNTALLVTFLIGTFNLNIVYSLNILGIFPYEGKSHFFVFKPYLEELAKRGHNVTVISYFPQSDPVENYNDISLAGKTKLLQEVFPISRSYWMFVHISLFLFNYGSANCRTLLANEQVQNLWKTKRKFDVIVVELFNSDCSLGLAHQLGAPVVGATTHTLMPYHHDRFGVPFNPSYKHVEFFEGGTKPTFYQRLERTIVYYYIKILHRYLSQRTDENILRQYFDDVPPLEELAGDIKLLLLYEHYTMTGSLLYPPNVIKVGGYHVAKPKPLPEPLKKFIEESEHGVLYISFGSMLKAASTPKDKLKVIISALSELPQRVVWKWEEKTLPGNPKNIYLSNWLPQNDILAHPKVMGFFSHAGMLGTTEAFYHGKPVIAMPIFGDQPSNAAAIEECGLGVMIQFSELTKETLLEKLKTILDPKFQAQAKRVSKLWHDRPMSPMDSAIYWTEYAARNRNFTFRSAAANVPTVQYLCLDVILFLLGVILVIAYTFKYVISLICCKRKQAQIKSKKQ
ncbi:unnamed protein product [Diatraea saccharalis]|uniref:UDP-glucuronosyltransferase n=1 Tax=Diatraea saccharalis TaxID=40085 RepID=A0A9N9R1R0_9NEOP|nr:unnamed protein product [Diatraea saccharalis]